MTYKRCNIITDTKISAEEKKHIAAVQKAMDERGKLNHTIIHGVFVGPARSGKNSLMERLLGRIPLSVSPSSGVAESVVQVKVMQKSATLAAKVEESVWSVMDYDEEAIRLMLINSEKQTEMEISHCEDETSHADNVLLHYKVHASSDHTNLDSESEEPQSSTQPKLTTQTDSTSIIQSSPTKQHHHVPTQLPDSYVPPIEIFKTALRRKGYEALQKHFEQTWSLYLTNTGGQIEFQEVLPLLVSGPSIFFFTFRLDRDLQEYYRIEYELSDGKKSYPYTSTLSTIDGMMQTLASISAMGMLQLCEGDKPLRPKVFFVGTHKDQLNSERANDTIANVDRELQKVIKNTACYKDLVEFASESQLIFTVNNFSDNDSDFQCIRLGVQRVAAREEFQMTSPTHWLIFSLALRKLKERVIRYDLSLEIAKQCGLADNEVDEALHFIHSKMGLIRYFPYEHSKNLVFIDPQFLFDQVTELIVSTFTFDKVCQYEMEQFKKKGIFSLDKLDEVCTEGHSGTIMSTLQFGKLLEELRIVVSLTIDNEMKYFLPCVLAHAHKSDGHVSVYDTPVPTLLISFTCGYIPKGVPGALIVYLQANEMKSSHRWSLQTGKIFKNEVSFSIYPYDTLTLRILPTHFKIIFVPNPHFADNERTKCPIREMCTVVYKAIDSGVEQILHDLNYTKTQHHITFPCPADECRGSHPAHLHYHGGYLCTLQCNITDQFLKVPKPVYDFWGTAFQAVYKGQQSSQDPVSTLPSKFTEVTDNSSHCFCSRPSMKIGNLFMDVMYAPSVTNITS